MQEDLGAGRSLEHGRGDCDSRTRREQLGRRRRKLDGGEGSLISRDWDPGKSRQLGGGERGGAAWRRSREMFKKGVPRG